MFLPVTFIVLLIVAACLILGIWLLRQAARDRPQPPRGTAVMRWTRCVVRNADKSNQSSHSSAVIAARG
ncbi:MAG: hypothetical protein HRU71_03605 [Planctomycetia bacterium]|nr:MAG: hypothetical protein HRU71_03605 [Planctomycetia bacterium]